MNIDGGSGLDMGKSLASWLYLGLLRTCFLSPKTKAFYY